MTWLTLTVSAAAACTDVPTAFMDAPTPPAGSTRAAALDKVEICHITPGQARIIEVGGPALADHLGHGDYVATLKVRRQGSLAGDGIHFVRIGDALASARAGRLARNELLSGACRITIVVSADVYPGSPVATDGGEQFPLMVDVPDITLRGAMVMELDGAGRATGTARGGLETVLAPTAPLPPSAGASTPIIIANGHPGGSAANGLTVEGFVFRSGPNPPATGAGQGLLSLRVSGITIRGNRFEAGFTESIDLRASSGDVRENHLSGTAGSCDICLAAPGNYRAIGNRLLAGGIPGITTSAVVGLPVPAGVEPFELPAAAEVWSEVRNNEVRNHLRTPVGVGIRVEAVGVMAPNVHNTLHTIIQDNLLVNNRFGIIVHAGFPVAGSNLRGDANVTLGGNVIEQVCQAKLLVSLSRHQKTLGLNAAPPYLLNSTFSLGLGGDMDWGEVWFGHPDGFGNSLIVDGLPVAHGIRQFYDAAGCPGL